MRRRVLACAWNRGVVCGLLRGGSRLGRCLYTFRIVNKSLKHRGGISLFSSFRQPRLLHFNRAYHNSRFSGFRNSGIHLVSKVEKEDEKPKKLSKWQKTKNLFKNYGWTFVMYWCAAYGVSFCAFYGALEMGVDAMEYIQRIGLDKYIDAEKINPALGNAIIAIALTELTEIIRFPVVIATTPALANYIQSMRGKSTVTPTPPNEIDFAADFAEKQEKAKGVDSEIDTARIFLTNPPISCPDNNLQLQYAERVYSALNKSKPDDVVEALSNDQLQALTRYTYHLNAKLTDVREWHRAIKAKKGFAFIAKAMSKDRSVF